MLFARSIAKKIRIPNKYLIYIFMAIKNILSTNQLHEYILTFISLKEIGLFEIKF